MQDSVIVEYQGPSRFQLEPVLGLLSPKDLIPLERSIVPEHRLLACGLERQDCSIQITLVSTVSDQAFGWVLDINQENQVLDTWC